MKRKITKKLFISPLSIGAVLFVPIYAISCGESTPAPETPHDDGNENETPAEISNYNTITQEMIDNRDFGDFTTFSNEYIVDGQIISSDNEKHNTGKLDSNGDPIIIDLQDEDKILRMIYDVRIIETATSIPDKLFQNIIFEKQLYIPNSVLTIGVSSFENSRLEWITLPSKLQSIGERAFANNKITSLYIPTTTKTIGSEAFINNEKTTGNFELKFLFEDGQDISTGKFGSKLTQYNGRQTMIDLNDISSDETINTIGKDAFRNQSLTSITFTNSITEIESTAFYDNNLTSLTLPSSIKIIGSSAFANNAIVSLTVPENVEQINSNAFSYNLISTLTLPISLKAIGESAFAHNEIEKLILPENITTLETNAFAYNKLKSLTSLKPTLLSNNSFANNTYTVGDYELELFIDSTNLSAEHNVAITEYNGTNKRIELDNSDNTVTELSDYQIIKIDDFAFRSKGLNFLSLPMELKHIGLGAFMKNNLAEVKLPTGIISIAPENSDGNVLQNGSFSQNTSIVLDYKLNLVFDYVNLKVRGFSVYDYVGTKTVIDFDIPSLYKIVEISDAYVREPNEENSVVFAGVFQNKGITAVELPSTLTYIGRDAFKDNPLLLSVSVPASVLEIGNGAFLETGLTTITLKEGTKIYDNTFENNVVVSYT